MSKNETEPAVEGEIVTTPPLLKVTKHDVNVVTKLEAAFNNGYNITEACQYAGIARKTYYEWLADDDAFSYRMSVAQSALNRKAKSNVATAIDSGDPNVSLRYLTLRDPDFKPKAQLEPPVELAETRQKIKDFLNDTNDGAYDDVADGEPDEADEASGDSQVAITPTDIS